MKRKGCSIILCLIVILFIAGVSFKVNRKEIEKSKIRSEMSLKEANTNSMAINVETSVGSGDYTKSTVPSTGSYKVNTDRSYCTIPGLSGEQKNIPMEYRDGKVYIGITDEGTKCYVWLDKQELLVDKIKDQVSSNGCPTYIETPLITTIEDTKSLLCKGIDDFGDTYYYRGAVTNNWVKLGKFYWRIIRINGNGSIRLIYSGIGKAETSGTDTQIGNSAYNNLNNNAQYVKYVYGSTNTDSTIKSVLDNWYNTNLKSAYGSIMDGEVGFCNDADISSTSYAGYQFFKPHDRIFGSTLKTATFICNTKADNLFTTSRGTEGNQKLTNPIGLITADEVSFAGGLGGSDNTSYYLYTGKVYWTMSPCYFMGSNNTAGMFIVKETGYLDHYYNVGNAYGVRPVINLKADTLFKTTSEVDKGTADNPYIVVI